MKDTTFWTCLAAVAQAMSGMAAGVFFILGLLGFPQAFILAAFCALQYVALQWVWRRP